MENRAGSQPVSIGTGWETGRTAGCRRPGVMQPRRLLRAGRNSSGPQHRGHMKPGPTCRLTANLRAGTFVIPTEDGAGSFAHPAPAPRDGEAHPAPLLPWGPPSPPGAQQGLPHAMAASARSPAPAGVASGVPFVLLRSYEMK